MPPGEGGRITIGVTVSASWDSWLAERILDRDCDTLHSSIARLFRSSILFQLTEWYLREVKLKRGGWC